MKRSLLVNVVLALFVAALGTWMTLKPGDTPKEEFRLSSLKRGDVRTIRISRKDLPEFVLERQGKDWVQTAPFKARTDSSQTGRLLDLAVATSRRKLPAQDLARFELDAPFARLTLDTTTFAFGTVNSLTNEQYVLAGDGVFLISPAFGFGLPTRRDSLASHMLLGEGEVPAGIETPQVSVVTRDGRLALSPAPPEAERPSQDDLQHWVEQWRFASSLVTQEAPAPVNGESVKVILKGGRVIEFVITQRQPQLLLVRRDENLQYAFPADQAARLLAPAPRP
ncbi:MAG: DUF4340 domain-containing protein [Betaproteobacteria bacterium]